MKYLDQKEASDDTTYDKYSRQFFFGAENPQRDMQFIISKKIEKKQITFVCARLSHRSEHLTHYKLLKCLLATTNMKLKCLPRDFQK